MGQWGTTTRCPVSVWQTPSGQQRNGPSERMSSCYCQHRVRTRQPLPTAAAVQCCDDRGRRMIDAMKGIELPAAAPKPLSPSAEAQSLADEAEATLWHSAQSRSHSVAFCPANKVMDSRTKYIVADGHCGRWTSKSTPIRAIPN